MAFFHRFRIVPVNVMHDMPVVGFKTFGGIVGKPAFGFAINGDAVVIVKADQFAQSQRTSQRTHLMRDPSIRQPSPIKT